MSLRRQGSWLARFHLDCCLQCINAASEGFGGFYVKSQVLGLNQLVSSWAALQMSCCSRSRSGPGGWLDGVSSDSRARARASKTARCSVTNSSPQRFWAADIQPGPENRGREPICDIWKKDFLEPPPFCKCTENNFGELLKTLDCYKSRYSQHKKVNQYDFWT